MKRKDVIVIVICAAIAFLYPVYEASASTTGSSVEVVLVTLPPVEKPTATPKKSPSPSPSISPSPTPTPTVMPTLVPVSAASIVVSPVVIEKIVTESAVVSSGSGVNYGDGEVKTVTDVYNLVFLIFLLEFYSTVRLGVKSAFAKIREMR